MVRILERTRGGQSWDGGVVAASVEYLAASVDKVFFVAPRPYRVIGVTGRVTVAGTDAGAVTAAIRTVASGTAIGSGTLVHSGTMNLKGTANTNQDLTLSTTSADLDLAEDEALAVDFTGTLTSATGVITVFLAPR